MSVALNRLLPLLLLALSACAQNSPQTPATSAARQAAAIEANRKGESYVRHGELENAARSYAEALRLSQSLEDAEGIAANAINLSIVRQRQGRFADARGALGAVMESRNLRFSPLRQAEAALRQALLDLDERKFGSAEEWVAKAAAHCSERCALSGAIHNVRAQLSLQAGRLDAAAASARAALDASRSANDRAETANAMRILGVTALRTGDAVTARAQLEQALALDREIGAPRKIAFDLVALGRAAALGGDRESARAFYARALAVSEADRDAVAAAEARALLEAVDKAATGK
ncbi:MAG TPA: tetratricopeptide repeat protein [Burkholderiales bacterium]